MHQALSATAYLPRRWRDALTLVTAERVAWLIIGFGALLRLVQYLFNSALYVDEAAIALNVINRSFGGLLQPLDFNQAAPVGFLMLEKIAVLALGESEYALRLFPLLFSMAALLLFYAASRRVLAGWAVPVALLFFAVSEQVIYYSSQVKQYSIDVGAALLILSAGLQIESKELKLRHAAVFAVIGVAAVWLSHPSVFVLGGVGATLAVVALKRKEWARVLKLVGCYALWVGSFAAFFIVSLSQLSANQRLETSWMDKGTFMPLLPASLSDLMWFPVTFFKMFSNPGDSPFPAVAGLVFIAGCLALLAKRKAHLLMLVSPLLLTLLASGLHKYPFGRRLLLFAAPMMLIVIAAGVELLVGRTRPYSTIGGFVVLEVALFQVITGGPVIPPVNRALLFIAISALLVIAALARYVMDRSKLYAAALGSIILAFLLLQPIGGATNQMLHPRSWQDIRPIMSYVSQRRQPGDLSYVYHRQLESFLYYAPKYGFNQNEYVIGTDARHYWKKGENDVYREELDRLRGNRRVWFLFSHVRSQEGVNEGVYFVRRLDTIGRQLDCFKDSTASAYLYDLTGTLPADNRAH